MLVTNKACSAIKRIPYCKWCAHVARDLGVRRAYLCAVWFKYIDLVWWGTGTAAAKKKKSSKKSKKSPAAPKAAATPKVDSGRSVSTRVSTTPQSAGKEKGRTTPKSGGAKKKEPKDKLPRWGHSKKTVRPPPFFF